jgi:hypothetical protein
MVSTPETISPQVWGKTRPLTYHKFLKKQGLLISCSTLYNIPILAVHKGPNKWKFVQDLWLINEAVIPLHPVVPNPYTLLAQIPWKPQYYSVLDFKDAFFCIPLHPYTQPLFAFEDPTNTSQQLTWTVLPQGFGDSPPSLWTGPNQRLIRLAVPRGHPSSICWWPTSVQSHRVLHLQCN